MVKICPNCGKELKDDEDFCPNCESSVDNSKTENINSKEEISAHNNKKPKDKKNILIALSLIGISCIALILFAVFSATFIPDTNTHNYSSAVNIDESLSESDYKAACEKIDFNNLSKNTDEYLYKKISYSGKVLQIMEYDGTLYIRLAVDANPDNLVYIMYDGTESLKKGDSIRIWGEVQGTYIYSSEENEKITLPLIYARFLS